MPTEPRTVVNNLESSADRYSIQNQYKSNSELIDQSIDKYSTNSRKKYMHSDYNEDVQNSQNTVLYSVSQRLVSAREGYACLGTTEWGPHNGSPDTTKDSNSEGSSDKQTTPALNIYITGSNTSSTSNPTSTTSSSASSSHSDPTGTQQGGANVSHPMQNVIPMCVYLMSRVAVRLDIEDTLQTTVAQIASAIISSDELCLNKNIADKIFILWMNSPLLELQLKPNHKPVEIRKAWRSLLNQYSHGSLHQQQRDEPRLTLQRNVFFPRQAEEKIKDQRILELLYEEAKYNILKGRYPCEAHHCITLGGIQARIELGPYNPQLHTTHFFREQQRKFLPSYVRKSSNWTWLPVSSKNSAEVKLLEQYKRIPASTTNRKLIRKYLEFCWSLPFYGCAFFQGQVEQPVRGLTSLMTHQDIPVLVAINSQGVYVIDDVQCTLLLGLKYDELSWDYARPSREDNPDCLSCLFLQFMVLENGARVSKVLQVFSRQANMMDTLISGFMDQLKRNVAAGASLDEVDRPLYDGNTDSDDTHMPLTMGRIGRRDAPQSNLSNKLSRLTLSTFDEDGHCIGQMGSWSFSY